MDFATYLRNRLMQRKFEQLEYSKLAVISRQQLSNILRGERTPPLHKLATMAKPLKLTPDELAEFRFLAAAAHIPEEMIRAEIVAVFYSQRRMKARLDRLDALLESDIIRRKGRGKNPEGSAG